MFLCFLPFSSYVAPSSFQMREKKLDGFTDEKLKHKEDEVGFPHVVKQVSGRAEKSQLVVVEREAVQSYFIWMVYVSANWIFI